jgi:hypothetical protein
MRKITSIFVSWRPQAEFSFEGLKQFYKVGVTATICPQKHFPAKWTSRSSHKINFDSKVRSSSTINKSCQINGTISAVQGGLGSAMSAGNGAKPRTRTTLWIMLDMVVQVANVLLHAATIPARIHCNRHWKECLHNHSSRVSSRQQQSV